MVHESSSIIVGKSLEAHCHHSGILVIIYNNECDDGDSDDGDDDDGDGDDNDDEDL